MVSIDPDRVSALLREASEKNGKGDLQKLLDQGDTWIVS